MGNRQVSEIVNYRSECGSSMWQYIEVKMQYLKY